MAVIVSFPPKAEVRVEFGREFHEWSVVGEKDKERGSAKKI